MRILTVLTYYAPHWTGLTTHAVRVAEGLADRGHQVTVLTTRHADWLPAVEIVRDVRIIRLPPVARFSRGMIVPTLPLAALRLIREHDVVQIHTPLPEALVVAGLCRFMSRPLVMTHHGDVVMPAGPVNWLIQEIGRWLLRGAGELATAVTTYSGDYAASSRLLRPLRSKLTSILPPVDVPRPDPARVAAWRTDLGLADRVLLGFAGRWVEEKGFDCLLAAMPLVRARIPQAHLVFAGETDVVYEDFFARCGPLLRAEQPHVTLLGLLREPQAMANFYAMCDLFVLPSRTDMLAMVQVEAMLCGTPVVATNIPGARVAVQVTGAGRLAPPDDPHGLAEAIVGAIVDREQLVPDRAVVAAAFSPRRAIDEYESLLGHLAREGRATTAA